MGYYQTLSLSSRQRLLTANSGLSRGDLT